MAFLGRRRGGADILITSLAVVPGDEIARGRRAHFDSTLPRGLGAATSSSTASSHEQLLLAAAAEVFATSGVDAPIRAIAARAGVGHATIYRHFPTRADLVVAVYRHQVEACAEEGASLLAGDERPADALEAWVGSFVDFLVTKHGLADMLRSDSDTFGIGSCRCAKRCSMQRSTPGRRDLATAPTS